MQTLASPIARAERIYTLDVIRGFALLGIYIMNMPWFGTSFFAGMDGAEAWPQWWDRYTKTATEVLFSGKFNSMFSMLFAVGFTILLERLEARDPARATSIYLRRIAWLFVFGAIHLCLFWGGDVLHMYAIFGLVLLALRRAPEKLLWSLFFVCLLFPVAMGVYATLTFTPERREEIIAAAQAYEATNNAAFGHGSFLVAAREHWREALYLYTDPINWRPLAGFYVQVFTTMVLGLILGRRRFFQESASHLPLIKRVQWWALGAGLATGFVFGAWEATVTDPVSPTPFKIVAMSCYWLSRVLVMTFYVATIIRCVHSEGWRDRLAPIAAAGRMPLTNYLLQTLIATTLFYGWGFGLWGKVGHALDLVFALAIFFAVLVPFSRWWLARHELGPMEWLWRRLTYGRGSSANTTMADGSGSNPSLR